MSEVQGAYCNKAAMVAQMETEVVRDALGRVKKKLDVVLVGHAVKQRDSDTCREKISHAVCCV